MEGKSSYFILLIIVAFLSITLAFLAIGFFFFGNSGSPSEKEVVVVTQRIPADEDLVLRPIFESKNFNLKKTDDKQIAVIVLTASMKHFKTDGKMKEADIVSKIDFYSKEINSAIGTYFQGLTLEDVSKQEAKAKAAEDLVQMINDIISGGDKKANPLVYSVIFEYWFYQ